MLEVTGYLRLE